MIPAKCQITEMRSADYLKRTEANVVDSDTTLRVTFGRPIGGSKRTLDFCVKHAKPYHHVDLTAISMDKAADDMRR